MKKGDKGAEVKALQTFLNQNGANLVVDGHFGRLTEKAVIEYQKANNLPAGKERSVNVAGLKKANPRQWIRVSFRLRRPGTFLFFLRCESSLQLTFIQIPGLLNVVGSGFPQFAVIGNPLVVHHSEHAVLEHVEFDCGTRFIFTGDCDFIHDFIFLVREVVVNSEP